MFKLTIDTGNDVCISAHKVSEIARTLHALALRIDNRGERSGNILDINGNIVGRFDCNAKAAT